MVATKVEKNCHLGSLKDVVQNIKFRLAFNSVYIAFVFKRYLYEISSIQKTLMLLYFLQDAFNLSHFVV